MRGPVAACGRPGGPGREDLLPAKRVSDLADVERRKAHFERYSSRWYRQYSLVAGIPDSGVLCPVDDLHEFRRDLLPLYGPGVVVGGRLQAWFACPVGVAEVKPS